MMSEMLKDKHIKRFERQKSRSQETIKEKTISQTIEQKMEEPERKETYGFTKEQLLIPQISSVFLPYIGQLKFFNSGEDF